MEAAQILIGGLIGAVGLIQAPGHEAGAPGVIGTAVAQTQITEVVAEFHIVGTSGHLTGEAAVGSAFLIAQLTQSDGDQVGAVVSGDGDPLVVTVIHTVCIGTGGA